jgi:hypothetical protein
LDGYVSSHLQPLFPGIIFRKTVHGMDERCFEVLQFRIGYALSQEFKEMVVRLQVSMVQYFPQHFQAMEKRHISFLLIFLR